MSPSYLFDGSQLLLSDVFLFCKMNMFLFPSFSNMIIDSVSRCVGSRLVNELVVRGFNNTKKKSMFVAVTSFVHFGQGLFCYSNF